MRCHAFTMSFSACISLASTFRMKGSWVHMCNYYKACHVPVCPLYLNRVVKEIFKVFTTILDVILLLLFLIVIFSIFGKHVFTFLLNQEFHCVLIATN